MTFFNPGLTPWADDFALSGLFGLYVLSGDIILMKHEKKTHSRLQPDLVLNKDINDALIIQPHVVLNDPPKRCTLQSALLHHSK
jgi:hypothetical protein